MVDVLSYIICELIYSQTWVVYLLQEGLSREHFPVTLQYLDKNMKTSLGLYYKILNTFSSSILLKQWF